MVDVSGIPNLGIPAMGGAIYPDAFAHVNNSVAANQRNMIPNMNANMAYVGGLNQAALNQFTSDFNTKGASSKYGHVGGYPSFGPASAPGTFSPGSGRSSYSGVSLGGYPSGQVTRGADLPQPDLGGYDPLGGGGGGGMVMGADGQFHYNDSAGLPQSPAPRANPYAQMYRMPAANPSYHNPGSYAGDKGNYGIPFNGRPMAGDIGYNRPPSYPNLGYNPSMQHQFANPAMNANPFQNRFGMGFPNAGTPSQYAPGAQMPPGFSRPYSFDEPGGALPILNNQTTGGGGA